MTDDPNPIYTALAEELATAPDSETTDPETAADVDQTAPKHRRPPE